jgi:hypothetical protein
VEGLKNNIKNAEDRTAGFQPRFEIRAPE